MKKRDGMNLEISLYDPSEMNENFSYPLPDPKLFEVLGEKGFQDMIDNFYELVAESDIAFFFPQDEEELNKVKKHNAKFFMEVCGGPNTYSEEMGGIDMIKMHQQFSINEKHRTEWLGTFREILEDVDVDEPLKEAFWNYLDQFSKLLVNRPLNARAFEDMVRR